MARKEDWEDAVNRTVEFVTSEYREAGGGSIDILMRIPGLAIGLENKLWEHWHDGPGERGQADRYRGLVGRYRRQQALPRFALVLLTCREGLQPGTAEDYPEDWLCVTWYDLGRALRSELKQVITGTNTLQAALDIWPVVLTLVALERDLLGLAHDAVHADGSDWRSLKELARLLAYLEE